MAEPEEKILAVGESPSTPHTITITIMEPSTLESSTLDSSLVTTVQAESSGPESSSVLVVSGDGQGSKNILQTVTETHTGAEELPIISNISNPDHEIPEESSNEQETKLLETFGDGECEMGEEEDPEDPLGVHCLICNIDMPTSESEDKVQVFKSQTSTSHRRLAIFLGTLIGQKLTSRKAHSDIMCRRCFSLLDRVDSLEVEIQETKDEIVNKYQETVAVHGGRARRRKPATAKKSDYVFPKVEPEDEDDQMLGMENDGTFEPHLDDLMEEEHDRREDFNADDEEWEPEFKRPRIKRENTDTDISGGPPKRKRGRPRKDAAKFKACVQSNVEGGLEEEEHIEGVKGKRPIKVKCAPKSTDNVRGKRRSGSSSMGSHIYLNELLSCPDCGELFNCEPLYKIHRSEAHIKSSSVKCPHCPLVFDKKYDLDSHLINHTPNNHSCKECGVGFPTAAILIKHLKEIHPDTANTCPRCSATFVNEEQLQFHIDQKHKRSKKKLTSSDKLELPSTGIMHIKRVHSDRSDFQFKCQQCGKVYLQEWELTLHNKTHTNERNYKCDICGDAFYTLSRMRYHKATHKTTRDSECPICSQMFRRDVDTKNHLRRVHKVLHPGQFMDLCLRHGFEKARELSQIEVVSSSAHEDRKTASEKSLDALDEKESEHITLYRVEGEQKPPVQVVIPDGMGMMVLEDTVMDISTASGEEKQEIALVYEVDESQQIIDIIN
ncbi:hypothetical protein Pmani_028644 [Petrolisthes manimaculis]|uniref:C2H2-type domain-containing protein n=1 Tax=Petrolisthes manimaculis TaxID=1843537 RepID=A0AAE1P133_9EUCA|nr:hypothetical protein Pmani_028644 [Petrolisthes manimaculis]